MVDSPHQAAEGPSPLTEADLASVDTLMETRVADIVNKSPSKYTKEELRVVVMYYRSQRARFLVEETKKANEPPKTRRKGGPPKSVEDALKTSDVEF